MATTYGHTDIHTYIHTYIQTDRQTEPKYDIDKMMVPRFLTSDPILALAFFTYEAWLVIKFFPQKENLCPKNVFQLCICYYFQLLKFTQVPVLRVGRRPLVILTIIFQCL